MKRDETIKKRWNKNYILILMLFLLGTFSYGQNWNDRTDGKEYLAISTSMDVNANLQGTSKNIALEIEKLFKRIYVRAEFRHVNNTKSAYGDVSVASGVHFSFFDMNESFYVGVREGAIFRNKKVFNTVGGEMGISLRLNKMLVVGVRTTLDYRTDLKIWNLPSKFVNSNYIKVGYVF